MKTRQQRAAINQLLSTKGLATLEDPGALLDQIGFLIRDHAGFRSLLLRLEPKQRKECYDSLHSRLRFEAKPLADYESEGAQIAEREQMPRWDPDNENLSARLTAYEPPAIGLSKIAEDAITRSEPTGTTLEVVCGRCGVMAIFHGQDRIFSVAKALNLPTGDRMLAIKQAREAGWRFEIKRTKKDGKIVTQEREVCPKCTVV